jgi:hypothetical protein
MHVSSIKNLLNRRKFTRTETSPLWPEENPLFSGLQPEELCSGGLTTHDSRLTTHVLKSGNVHGGPGTFSAPPPVETPSVGRALPFDQ